jgi:hypothetical protein
MGPSQLYQQCGGVVESSPERGSSEVTICIVLRVYGVVSPASTFDWTAKLLCVTTGEGAHACDIPQALSSVLLGAGRFGAVWLVQSCRPQRGPCNNACIK